MYNEFVPNNFIINYACNRLGKFWHPGNRAVNDPTY